MLAMKGRLDLALGLVEARLGKVDYFAGRDFTTADIMIVFTLTTMRYFLPFDLAPYPGILAYLQRIAQRDAYQRAMRKGRPRHGSPPDLISDRPAPGAVLLTRSVILTYLAQIVVFGASTETYSQ